MRLFGASCLLMAKMVKPAPDQYSQQVSNTDKT